MPGSSRSSPREVPRVSSAEHERLLRRARMQDVALFRYRLIGPALEEGLTTKQRGRVVRGIAGQVHAGPGGRGVQVSRKTIDRWIRAWNAGGFTALLPDDRKCEPVTPEPVLALAAALKRENMERTAAQVRRIMVASSGDAPSERTLQRHFAREDLTTPRGTTVFGRFEAEAPNVLWTGDVLCRHRHKTSYEDVPVMPPSPAGALWMLRKLAGISA